VASPGNQAVNEGENANLRYEEKPVHSAENIHELPDRTVSLAGSDYDIYQVRQP
jgi:hypothetical protein